MIYLYTILALNTLWLVILTFTFFKILTHYQKLSRGVSGQNLMGVWEKYLEKERQNEVDIKELKLSLEFLKGKSRKPLQKVAVTRFNPFNDAGGNQSFCVSLLDENGDGVVLSSLHGRDKTFVYGKPVKAFGPAGFDFSQEEQDAVFIAKNPKH